MKCARCAACRKLGTVGGVLILTIDNLDRQAAPIDYSAAPSARTRRSTIERAPQRALALHRLSGRRLARQPRRVLPTLPVPVRRARVVVSADSGTVLFTGYLATEPVPVYAGVGLAGPVYRVAFSAVSDEWLLDKQSLTLTGDGFTVRRRLAALRPSTTAPPPACSPRRQVQHGNPIGVFTPRAAPSPGPPTPAAIAGSTYAAYRALNGALCMQTGRLRHPHARLRCGRRRRQPPGRRAQDHDGQGTRQRRHPQRRDRAHRICHRNVSGRRHNHALHSSRTPRSAPPSPRCSPTAFNQPALNTQTLERHRPRLAPLPWRPEACPLTGGTGADGQTTLAAIDQVETRRLARRSRPPTSSSPRPPTASSAASTPAPLSAPTASPATTSARAAGSTLLTPFVNGAEVGTSYTLLTGHAYTLRIRLHSPEVQRVLQTYYARVDGAIESFGGGLVSSPVSLVFDLIDLGNASSRPATVLYDGAAAAASPFRPPPAPSRPSTRSRSPAPWASHRHPDRLRMGRQHAARRPAQPRRASSASPAKASTARVSATGKVTFFAGRIPVAGELVTVSYRMRSRAVARLEDAASVAAEAAGECRAPPAGWAKSSARSPAAPADCESAAQAVLSLRLRAAPPPLAGSYAAINPHRRHLARRRARHHRQRPDPQRRRPHRSPSPMATPSPNSSPIASPLPTTGPNPSASLSPRPSPPTPSSRPPQPPRPRSASPTSPRSPSPAPPPPRSRSTAGTQPAHRRRLRSPPARLGFLAHPRRRPGPPLARPQLHHPPRPPSPSATSSASTTPPRRLSTRASPPPSLPTFPSPEPRPLASFW